MRSLLCFSYHGYVINHLRTYSLRLNSIYFAYKSNLNWVRWSKLISALLAVGLGSSEGGEGNHLRVAFRNPDQLGLDQPGLFIHLCAALCGLLIDGSNRVVRLLT
jgi:hypothetical protein